jgi:hypothetical protein
MTVIANQYLDFLSEKDLRTLVDSFVYCAVQEQYPYLVMNELLMPLLSGRMSYENNEEFFEGYFQMSVDFLLSNMQRLEELNVRKELDTFINEELYRGHNEFVLRNYWVVKLGNLYLTERDNPYETEFVGGDEFESSQQSLERILDQEELEFLKT